MCMLVSSAALCLLLLRLQGPGAVEVCQQVGALQCCIAGIFQVLSHLAKCVTHQLALSACYVSCSATMYGVEHCHHVLMWGATSQLAHTIQDGDWTHMLLTV
jgi:hypothetical protein